MMPCRSTGLGGESNTIIIGILMGSKNTSMSADCRVNRRPSPSFSATLNPSFRVGVEVQGWEQAALFPLNFLDIQCSQA